MSLVSLKNFHLPSNNSFYSVTGSFNDPCHTVLLLVCLSLQSHRKGLGLTDLASCLSCPCLSPWGGEDATSPLPSPSFKCGLTLLGLSLDRLLSLNILSGDISLVLMGDSGGLGLCDVVTSLDPDSLGGDPGCTPGLPALSLISISPASLCAPWLFCCLDLPLWPDSVSSSFPTSLLFSSTSVWFSLSLLLSRLCCLVMSRILLWRSAPPMP